MLTNTTIGNQLRKQHSEVRRALRNLITANRAYSSALFLDEIDSPEAERAAAKLDKRMEEAQRILDSGTRKPPNRR